MVIRELKRGVGERGQPGLKMHSWIILLGLEDVERGEGGEKERVGMSRTKSSHSYGSHGDFFWSAASFERAAAGQPGRGHC